MRDEGLRSLERAAEGGDLSASARLLRQRLRLGESDEAAVRLLARLGDSTAAQVVGGAGEELEPLGELWGELCSRDPALGVRALWAGAVAALPRLERWLPDELGPRQALEAVETWLESPGDERAGVAAELAGPARAAVDRVNAELLGRYQLGMLSGSELRALEYTAWTARDAAHGALQASCGEAPAVDSLARLERLAAEAGWGELREPIRAALAPLLVPGR